VVTDGPRLLSNVIRSQDALHAPYGGVVPELAARAHLQTLVPVIERALEDAGTRWEQIDAVGVTRGPGLIGCLLVGVNLAQAIAYARSLPVIGVSPPTSTRGCSRTSSFVRLCWGWLSPAATATLSDGSRTARSR